MTRPKKTRVPRVRFTQDYPYTPSAERRVCTKYRAGWEGPVTQECADKAIAAGVAELIIPEKPDASRPPPGTADVPTAER